MASFADISIRFSANLKQFSSQIQNANRDLQKFGRQMTRTGTALTVGLTAPIGALAVKSVQAFDAQSKALAQVEAGLKSTGNAANRTLGDLVTQAEELQKTTLFGDEEIFRDVTTQLQTFTNIANEQFDRTQVAALDLATKLDGDLKSASIQLGKALNDPIANLSALSRSGIQFSTEQKKVIKSLTETGRLAEAQTIILDELENQYGGAAAAAAKAGTGPFKQLGNSIGDLTEDFGKIITEALIPFVEEVRDVVSSMKNWDDSTKKTAVVIAGFAAVLGPLLTAIGFMATTVIPGLISAFTALRAALLANPFAAVAAGVGLLVAAMVSLKGASDDAVRAQSTFQQVSEAAQRSISAEKAKLEELLFIARDEQVSKEQRVKAIKELNALSPKYLGNLSLEEINTDKARKAIEKYNEALLATAKVKAAQGKLQEIQEKIIDAEIKASKSRQESLNDELLAERLKQLAIQNGTTVLQERKKLQDALDVGYGLRIKNLNDEAAALLEIIKNNDAYNASLRQTPTGDGGVGEGSQGFELGFEVADLEELDTLIANTGGRIADAVDAANVGSLFADMDGAVDQFREGKEEVDELVDQFIKKQEQLRATANLVADSVAGAFENFTGRFVNSLGLANDGLEGFAKSLISTVTELISMYLANAIAASIAGATQSGSATGPAAVFTTPAFIATAVAGVVAAFAAIPKFAEGGLVYGPTLGLMGEYSGARNNPEVIAPLNKLKELINPAGGQLLDGQLVSVVRGDDLLLVHERAGARKSRRG